VPKWGQSDIALRGSHCTFKQKYNQLNVDISVFNLVLISKFYFSLLSDAKLKQIYFCPFGVLRGLKLGKI
jgi:hypothetical protein